MRNTKKLLRNKIVYFKEIYSFDIQYFFTEVTQAEINNRTNVDPTLISERTTVSMQCRKTRVVYGFKKAWKSVRDAGF